MTVFILGAGVMQIPALDAARELGWRVAAADGNAEAPGASRCDRFFPVDLKDRQGLLAAAKALRVEGGLEAVFTAGTDFSAMVAFLADALGLPGHTYEAAEAASDKLLMRARFDAAGLPSPRFVEVDAPRDLVAVAGLGLPLVVKPADNMGARGCRLARDVDELGEAIEFALPLSRTGRVIVEEYIEGPEYSIDALIYDGELRIHGFADRHIYFSPYFVELGHTIPSLASPDISAQVLEVFEAGVRSLGLSHGAAKGDMKWCPSRGSPVIGEIAARLSGGYMSGWTYPYASGHDLTKDGLLLAAGLRPHNGVIDRGWTSVERAYISIPGRVASTSGLRAARYSPHIKDLFVRARIGDRVVFPSNNVEKCGNLISQAPTRREAIEAAEICLQGILIRLVAPDEATEAFLRGEGRKAGADGLEWPPPAFTLPPELAAELNRMPDFLGEGGQIVVEAGATIEIASLPGIETIRSQDWLGRTFAQSLELALGQGGAVLVNSSKEGRVGTLAGRFWRALALGGSQAAIYVLDALRQGTANR